jgi:thiol:disulfide interchange protein
MPRLFALFLLLLSGLFSNPAAAQLGGGQPHIRPALVAETLRPAAGSTVTLAIRWTPEPGWHGYWQNPGDSGVETRTRWTLPAGVTAGPLAYPVPRTLVVAGLMNHVYEAPYAHLVRLTLPKGLAPGTRIPLRAKIDWLECTTEICVPGSGPVSLDLIVGDGAVDPGVERQFATWRAALPRPLGGAAAYAVKGDRMRLAIPLPASVAVVEPHFFAMTPGVIDYAAAQSITRSGDTLIVETKRGDEAPSGPVEGVLRIGRDQGLSLVAQPGTVPAAGTPVAAKTEASGDLGVTFALALLGAIAGGLLLNVMPCVFPILSLKALSLARSGGTEAHARAEALAYTGGIVAVCLLLGGGLLLLRAGGSAAGWAFQLQDPRVILALMVLVLGIALNLAGLFELGSVGAGERLVGKGGIAGAFWTGALAAFVATPCTGPFMAGALGAALLLPPAAALAIFAGLGLGLALPFLVIGFVPAARRMLPRPGAWMGKFRRLLSVPMFLTALGLAWILGRQAGVDGMTLGLGAALVVALGLWIVGRRQAAGTGRRWLPLVPALIVAGLAIGIVPTESPAVARPAANALGAEPFSEARLAALRQEGRPVFVYFTADWCLTCKVNEKVAIDRADTAAAFAAKKVAVLVGDWTRGDAAIGRVLEANNRSGVPLYLFYPAGGAARELPQVLTPAMLAGLAG